MDYTRDNALSSETEKNDASRDPMTCGPPVPAAVVGDTTGRTKGAAIGDAIGHAIGVGTDVVVGTFAEGVAAGKKAVSRIRDLVNPRSEHEFWRKEFPNCSYFTPGTLYEQYGPAFQYGWESCLNHEGKTFKDAEAQLAHDWDGRRGRSTLSWDNARDAVRDAWQRVEQRCIADEGCTQNE